MTEEAFSKIFQRLIWLAAICLPLAAPAVETAPAPAASNAAPAAVAAPQPSYLPLTNLTFDSETKVYDAKAGDTLGTFTFQVTNISDVPVHILAINASCSCTHAEMPETPWILMPHTHGEFHAMMQLAGKAPGENTKGLTILSTNGVKQLLVKSMIPAPDNGMFDRLKNQQLATGNRQAVFQNDCARCHVEKSRGLMGAALYKEACGICHDSEHRASMVPDLGSLNHPTDAAFWRTMISDGKDKSLMPAFSAGHGGPLSNDQIESLVEYMTKDFPREHKPTPQLPFAAAAPVHASMPPPRAPVLPPPLPRPAAQTVHQ
jgi:mono/diheme cytochrome c family protein